MEEHLKKVNGGHIAYSPEKPGRKSPKKRPSKTDESLVSAGGTLFRISKDTAPITQAAAKSKAEASYKIATKLEKLKAREAYLAPLVREYTGDKTSEEYEAMLAEIKSVREEIGKSTGTRRKGTRPEAVIAPTSEMEETETPKVDAIPTPREMPQSLNKVLLREDKIPEPRPGIFTRLSRWFNRGKEEKALAEEVAKLVKKHAEEKPPEPISEQFIKPEEPAMSMQPEVATPEIEMERTEAVPTTQEWTPEQEAERLVMLRKKLAEMSGK